MTTRILFILFLLLATGTGFYFYSQNLQETAKTEERDFSIKDTDQVYRIFMADRNGNKVDLKKRDDQWIYKDKYVARENAVENVLETLRRVEVRYKPAQALEENMIVDLATNGIHVQIMNKSGKILKDFYVGGVTNDETGTYMIMEGSDQPFVTHMNGFEGGLRARFLMKEKDWRDRTVYNIKMDEIQSVSVEYPKQKNNSFQLKRTNEGFQVETFYEITPQINKPVHQGKAEGYLIGFEDLIAESFENESPLRDSISQMIPFSIVTLTQKDGVEKTIRLHAYQFGDQYDDKGNPIVNLENVSSIERYLADVSTGDFMLVQHQIFKRILWGYDYFF